MMDLGLSTLNCQTGPCLFTDDALYRFPATIRFKTYFVICLKFENDARNL